MCVGGRACQIYLNTMIIASEPVCDPIYPIYMLQQGRNLCGIILQLTYLLRRKQKWIGELFWNAALSENAMRVTAN